MLASDLPSFEYTVFTVQRGKNSSNCSISKSFDSYAKVRKRIGKLKLQNVLYSNGLRQNECSQTNGKWQCIAHTKVHQTSANFLIWIKKQIYVTIKFLSKCN